MLRRASFPTFFLMTSYKREFSYASPEHRPWENALIRLIEKSTGQPRLVRLYEENRAQPVDGESFFDAALRKLNVRLAYDEARLAAVPKQGPLVVVANHPYGVLDGIAAMALVGRVRPDAKVLINAVLTRPEEMAPFALPIDFNESPQAIETNLQTRAQARLHLGNGGTLVVFPGGTVSTRTKVFRRNTVSDPLWKPFAVQLIQRSRASVLPIFFRGQNSWLFHAASHVNPNLRVALLFNEVRRRMDTDLPIEIGEVLHAETLPVGLSRTDFAEHLRQETYRLGGEGGPSPYGRRLARRLKLEEGRDPGADAGGEGRPRLRTVY